ncbi:HD domain-containing phosphohydrolase [Leptothrix sp. BB-4]
MTHPTRTPLASWRLSIEAALLGGIVVASVLVAVLVGWQVADWGVDGVRSQLQLRLSVNARDIALRLAATLDERLNDVEQARDTLQQDIPREDGAARQRVVDRYKAGHPQFAWLGLVGPDGRVLAGSDGVLVGSDQSRRDWFVGAMKGQPYYGDLHAGVALDMPTPQDSAALPMRQFDVALPMLDDQGRVESVLVSHFRMDVVIEALEQSLASPSVPGFAATLAARDGTILHDTAGSTGNLSSLKPALRESGKLAVELRWPDRGDAVYAACEPVSASSAGRQFGWLVVVREPAAAIQQAQSDVRWRTAAICFAGGALLSLIALVLVRRVTRPMRALVTALRRFGDHERHAEDDTPQPALTPLAPTRLIEIELLQQSFLGMTQAVQGQHDSLYATQLQILQTLGRAGEFRDNETGDHVQRMSRLCAHLARLVGLPPEQVGRMRLASQLHDIGKIGIPDHILLKPGRLDDEERRIMSRHPLIGARILAGLDTPLLHMAREIALTHHERWDGSGYPEGLRGAAIPIAGRIVAICDVYDALSSSRPYKKAWPRADVLDYLRRESGRQFDPDLVRLFLEHEETFAMLEHDTAPAAEAATGGHA